MLYDSFPSTNKIDGVKINVVGKLGLLMQLDGYIIHE